MNVIISNKNKCKSMCESLYLDFTTSFYNNIPSPDRIGICITIDIMKDLNIPNIHYCNKRFFDEACIMLHECFIDLSTKKEYPIEYYKNRQFMASMLIKASLEQEEYKINNDNFNSIMCIVNNLFKIINGRIVEVQRI